MISKDFFRKFRYNAEKNKVEECPMFHFLIHDPSDSVGVATQDIKKGQRVIGRYLDSSEEISLTAQSDVPLGHKIALRDHPVGDSVIKYGHDIGRVVLPIRKGEHVHVHNLKTKRW